MVEHLFSGSALCDVDAGGNLVLPGFVRATLGCRTAGRTFLVGAHECDPCLAAYDVAYARILHGDSERRRILHEAGAPVASAQRLRRIFGFSEEVAFAEDGAFVLPPMMRRRARIGARALVVGVGGLFELWNPEAALEQGGNDLREIAGFHLEPRAAA